MELILNYIMSFIQSISTESWMLIGAVVLVLFFLAKIVSTILRPVFQVISIAFMLFSMYKFAIIMNWF